MTAIDLTAYQPTTLDEAITYLFDGLDDEAREMLGKEFITYGEDDDPHQIRMPVGSILHHGAMMEVRNVWGLWRSTSDASPLRDHFRRTFGLGHADDMSGLIQKGLVARVQGQSFDPYAAAERSKAHWRALGIDPLRQEPISAAQ